MRRAMILLLLVSAGCGGTAPRARPTATPTATEVVAAPRGPWTVREQDVREPLRCPASSTRAGWPSRVLALGDDRYVKLWARRPRLATVDARGHVLRAKALGARKPAQHQALACGRGGRTAVAWTEYEGGDGVAADYRVVVDGTTVETVRGAFGDPDLAVAFAPDGSALVAYSVPKAVHAVWVPPGEAPGAPFTLGPASDVSAVAAEFGSGGRAIVAWSTIDAGEGRNERRRVYAVTGRGGTFARAQRVHRARHLNISESTEAEIRLAVAPNGRALLMWQSAPAAEPEVGDPTAVWIAQASPSGRFGTPRRLTDDGTPGDVAIRSDGDALAVWTSTQGLFSGRDEQITDKATQPRASFRDGKPHVEWRGAAASRG